MKRAFVVRLGTGIDAGQRVDVYVADMQTGRELMFHSLDELRAFLRRSVMSNRHDRRTDEAHSMGHSSGIIAELDPPSAVAENNARAIRVLFVEDHPAIVEILLEKLSKSGFNMEAKIVSTRQHFERELRDANYDLILCDYQMAGWTGRDALNIRNELCRSVPFVLVSGEIDDEGALDLLKAGATDFILKNHVNRLTFVVRRALIEQETREERQLFIKALEQSEQRYRVLFDNNPQPMWVYAMDNLRFLAVNRAAIDRYGYSHAEFLSRTLKDLTPPDVIPTIEQGLRTNIQTATSITMPHMKKNRERFYVEVTQSPLEFEGREAMLALMTDVSERLQAEESLRRSEAEHRSIIEGAPYGICRIDQAGRVLMANPALVSLLGYDSEAELCWLNIIELYRNSGDGSDAMKHLRGQKEMLSCEAEWKTKRGAPISVKLSGRELPDGEAPPQYEIFVEDITERRSLEQQVRQAQKMEAVGRLAGGVAHDFNNLLTVIKGYSVLAADTAHDTTRVREALEEIRLAADRGAGLTQQLLAFSRRQILEPAILDLNLLIPKLIDILSRLVGESISVIFQAGERLGNVKADRGQIEQAILNLAVNARDAMPNGGRLTIETANVELDEKYSSRHGVAVTPGSYVMLSVSDTGIGMSSETQSHIFEPFFTTKEPGQGTGLGLASVYGFVKQSGGSIWVYSEIGKGSTFKIYLPRVGEVDRSSFSKPALEMVPGGSETILLVEDEVKLRTVIATYLRSKGYRILEATNGTEGIRIHRDHAHGIHLLITDMVMPESGGIDVAKACMAIQPDLKVIYMSGYTDRGFDETVTGSSSSFLKKPFAFEALAEEIRRLLGGPSRRDSARM